MNIRSDQYPDHILDLLGYRYGSHDEMHEPLRAVPFGAHLAERALAGDREAARLLSHEVLELIPAYLDESTHCRLLDFVEAHPERFPRDRFLNQQAWRLPDEEPCYLALLKAVRNSVTAYRERMGSRHEYFRQRLTYSNLPPSHVSFMAPASIGYPHMRPHIHGGAVFNAVYYLHAPAPDEGGLIRFGGVAHDALPGTPAQHPLTFICPPSNALLIFPSYMVHGVTDYLGTEPRRSISMGM